MVKIYVVKQSRYPADTQALKKRVREVLDAHSATSAEVTIALVGERKMRELAQKHLNEGLEVATHEVLSFPIHDRQTDEEFIASTDYSLGDIVICYPEARKIAMRKNRLVDEVLGELAEHGTLHLLGIHHGEIR